ncbi:MobF family relaxase, partial [Streptomyces benahoarensis]
PEIGEKLVQNADQKNRVALHDFTLSPPKSVSVIWSQAGDKVKGRIEDIQNEAAREFLDYISVHAVTRQGKAGVIHKSALVRGAMFSHGSSRENDPQLHTHCVVMNVVELEDGSTGALENREMLRWQGAAASLYHADLAYKLGKEGFPIRKVKNLFEIDGVPDEVMKDFSQRRVAILKAVEAEMASRGLDASQASRGLLQKATIETRQEKTEMSRYELEGIWKERGKALGFSEEQVNEIIDSESFTELSREECLEQVRESAYQILQGKAVFGEPELVAKAASAMIGKASRSQILEAVSDLKGELLVCHGEHSRDTVFTSREMVALEHEMLQLAERRNGSHVIENFELPASLSEEQRIAAEATLRDENDVTVVEGSAGAGKTFTMASV